MKERILVYDVSNHFTLSAVKFDVPIKTEGSFVDVRVHSNIILVWTFEEEFVEDLKGRII